MIELRNDDMKFHKDVVYAARTKSLVVIAFASKCYALRSLIKGMSISEFHFWD